MNYAIAWGGGGCKRRPRRPQRAAGGGGCKAAAAAAEGGGSACSVIDGKSLCNKMTAKLKSSKLQLHSCTL